MAFLLYSWISASLSPIREPSSCNKWELTYRPTTWECAESERVFQSLSPKWHVFIKPFPSSHRNVCGRGDRVGGSGWLLESSISQLQQAWYTYEFTQAVMTAHTRLAEACPSTYRVPAQRPESDHTVPSLTKIYVQLIATRREKSLLLGVTRYIKQPRRQDLCLGVVGQHKIESIFFFVLFCFGLVW